VRTAPAEVIAEPVTAPAPAPAPAPLAAPGLEPAVLQLALDAASRAEARGLARQPRTLSVIDYSLPSTEKRLWVFDLATRELLFHELVAHGKNTGANLATSFSNRDESKQTSLGLFVTDATYHGGNGYSLRLDGLDAGFNDNARRRAIVMHGADYVSAGFARAQGRIGRSWGCPAVPTAVHREIIDAIKGGGLVFAYYPDRGLLERSEFLRGSAAAGQLLASLGGPAGAVAAR
jgi:hypothetical protein